MHQRKGRVTPNRNASRNVYTNIHCTCNSPLDLVLTCLARHDALLCLFPAKLCFLLFTIERPLLNKPASCWWCFLSEHFSELADNISYIPTITNRSTRFDQFLFVTQLNDTYHRSRDRTLFYRFDCQIFTKKCRF